MAKTSAEYTELQRQYQKLSDDIFKKWQELLQQLHSTKSNYIDRGLEYMKKDAGLFSGILHERVSEVMGPVTTNVNGVVDELFEELSVLYSMSTEASEIATKMKGKALVAKEKEKKA